MITGEPSTSKEKAAFFLMSRDLLSPEDNRTVDQHLIQGWVRDGGKKNL